MADTRESCIMFSSTEEVAEQHRLYLVEKLAMARARSANAANELSVSKGWKALPSPHAGLSGGVFCRWRLDPSNAFQAFAAGTPIRVTVNSRTAASLRPSLEQARMAQALHESREELRRLSGRLVSIQEDERRRIALDLHDGLGQTMSLIKLSLENAVKLLSQGATCEAGESLQDLICRVKDALGQVRRVSTELRPSILDDLGILPTLSWHFREFEAVCGGIRVEKAFHVAEEQVPVALHITLYRILQEALHNILKHSGADLVRVRLERMGDTLHLQVDDNGRGFDPDSIAAGDGRIRGFGLSSMKERASYSGGSWQLRSGPGGGTSITVSWPCAQATK